MKTEPLTVGAEATVYVWFLSQIFVNKTPTYSVASDSALNTSGFTVCLDSDYFWDSAPKA